MLAREKFESGPAIPSRGLSRFARLTRVVPVEVRQRTYEHPRASACTTEGRNASLYFLLGETKEFLELAEARLLRVGKSVGEEEFVIAMLHDIRGRIMWLESKILNVDLPKAPAVEEERREKSVR